MGEKSRDINPKETIALAAEALNDEINGDKSQAELIGRFNTLESSVFAGTQQGALSLEEGLITLNGYCGRLHEISAQAGSDQDVAFFVSKTSTYTNLMETIAQKPAAKPRKTDTATKQMSGGKSY